MTTALLRIGLAFCDDVQDLGATERRAQLVARATALRVMVARQFSDDPRGIDETRLVEECTTRALDELRDVDVHDDEQRRRTAIERGELFLHLFRRNALPVSRSSPDTAR